MKTSDEQPIFFDPWEKVKHAWDKPETIGKIAKYNENALPTVDDFIAVFEDIEENEPELLDLLFTFQEPETMLDEGMKNG